MKVVAFNGSARRDGNTAILIRAVSHLALVPMLQRRDVRT